MASYRIHFSKSGCLRYVSHLDVIRIFKRAFKRAGIQLAYSQGFNPHPKMGFAQPLALGYTGDDEVFAFDTLQSYQPEDIRQSLNRELPAGMDVSFCAPIEAGGKSLASMVCAAEYEIRFPLEGFGTGDPHRVRWNDFLQEAIMVPKKNKKTKSWEPVNIRPQIRQVTSAVQDDQFCVTVWLDAGSQSHLSPELVIPALMKFLDLPLERSDIEVTRLHIKFDKNTI